MTFQALLFCQDSKTARVTTQLLNELEFSVETSNEPFAAVKKLMGQHFDAVVVDCENEQNASLLFKGARNSALNQSSLAVAVVEGQAGVANAFRIGANLVLTKPINIEQAKGTLRVARGLLKKGGETAKASAATAPAPGAPAPAAPTFQTPAKTPTAAPSGAPAKTFSNPVLAPPPAKPAPMPAAAKASADSSDVLEVETSSSVPAEEIWLDALEEQSPSDKAVARPDIKPASLMGAAESARKAAKEAQRPVAVPTLSAGGAASAPAPAKAPALPEFEKLGDPGTAARLLRPAPARSDAPQAVSPSLHSQSVPTFAGLDSTPAEQSGGAGKFAIIAIVILALAAAAYFGYTKFGKQAPAPSDQHPPASSEPAATTENPPSALVTAAPLPQKPKAAAAQPTDSLETAPHKTDSAKTGDAEPEVVVTRVDPEPRVVKANPSSASAATKSKEADVQAPSAFAAAPGDDSQISQIVSSAPVTVPAAAAPAQRLRVSQGITQGLLLKRVQPVYPHQALQMRISGAVQLLAVIDKEGFISNLKVLSGDPILARAALDAVSHWRYKPYTLDGEPVDIETQLTVNFRLP